MKLQDVRALVRAVLDMDYRDEWTMADAVGVPSAQYHRARLAAQVLDRELAKDKPTKVQPLPEPIEIRRRYDGVPGARLVWPWFELLPDGTLDSCGLAFRGRDADGLMRQVVVSTADREALLDDLRLCIELVDKYREGAGELLGLSAEDIARLIEVPNHAAL